MAVSPAPTPPLAPRPVAPPRQPRHTPVRCEKGIAMDRHPLHALYLGRTHGEAATLPLRARLARARADEPDGAVPVPAAALALVVAAVAVVNRLVGRLAGGR